MYADLEHQLMSEDLQADRDDRLPAAGDEDNNSANHFKIFVGGLSWETNEDSLTEYFSQFGNVSDCVIMRDRHTKHPRGFGFISYDNAAVANKVASQKHILDGRQVEAKHAVPRSDLGTTSLSSGRTQSKKQGADGLKNSPENAPKQNNATSASGPSASAASLPVKTKKIFVGGLPSQCRSEELREQFSSYGRIVDAQVLIDHKTGNSRGFGFVTFADEAAVEAVMGPGQSSSIKLEVLGKLVEVKKAEPKQVLDARKSRDTTQSGASGRVGSGTNYNAGVGLMHITPLLSAQYSNYYGSWPQYVQSQSPPSSMPYLVQHEFNPYVYDTLYGNVAQGVSVMPQNPDRSDSSVPGGGQPQPDIRTRTLSNSPTQGMTKRRSQDKSDRFEPY
mmetsp:Transcript_10581/g.32376  ORF Transcript_10581/g.32376 Transcript_10581/m.32376 type:complete len:390 (+) Transcript_10581:414-1583(+)